jgi:hypothetical protein
MKLRSLFKRRLLWSIGIYKLEFRRDVLHLEPHSPIHMVGERGLRTRLANYQSTVADPFLFSFAGTLYLFYEVMGDAPHGEIWAQSMSTSGEWKVHGPVLIEGFHLSYPQVFEHQGRIYMLPEASNSGLVTLYSAVDFPSGWKPCATLISEPLLDPTLFFHPLGGFSILATSRNYELKLYHSKFLEGPYLDTGVVVSRDPSISRSAGAVLEIDGDYYRPAQDCSRVYGERIRLLKIGGTSHSDYEEALSVPDLIPSRPQWMMEGYHHISTAVHDGSVYVAVDGRRKDSYINTIMLMLLRLADGCFGR